MGYAIAIRAENKASRNRMLDFMQLNYRTWAVVSGKKAHEHAGDPSDEFYYDSSSQALGFEYTSGLHGWERTYIFSIVRWMAIKIGQRKTRFNKEAVEPNVFPKPVPFMVYDGYEHWPILIVKNAAEAKRIPIGARWCAMDKLGVYIGSSAQESLVSAALEEMIFDRHAMKAFHKELATIGKWPEKQGPEREKMMRRYKAIKAKHARPVIRRVLPRMRREVERLDQLWRRSALKR
jgi:hypothetical protein